MKNGLRFLSFFLLIAPAAFFSHCNEPAGAKEPHAPANSLSSKEYHLPDEFKKYWYAGKAELSSYKLKQARYGEIHDGYAVTIFVTEDFSKSKQVKLDRPEAAGADRLPVLKLNLVKKFNTGIYPYSLMLSVFSPVDISASTHAVKTVASVQEWCGMTFTQINNRNGKYETTWDSYFESESDGRKSFELCWLEDELWNLMRIAPDRLPTGKQKVLPGSLYTRLSHQPLEIQDAVLTLNEDGEKMGYKIEYAAQQHSITIQFEKAFPHRILGWEETFPGFDGKLLTTTATLDKTVISDYWVHHTNADRVMREELDLPMNY